MGSDCTEMGGNRNVKKINFRSHPVCMLNDPAALHWLRVVSWGDDSGNGHVIVAIVAVSKLIGNFIDEEIRCLRRLTPCVCLRRRRARIIIIDNFIRKIIAAQLIQR